MHEGVLDMDPSLFLKAALIGLTIAAPVGPIGLLCVQRSLAHGGRIGFASGLGAATADATYGAIGAFGMSALTSLFLGLGQALALIGALFLGWMGLQLLRTEPRNMTADAGDAARPVRAFASVFVLTLANPMTILSFIAVFAVISGGSSTGPGSAAIMVSGVFAGSALWWLTLSCGVATIRHRIGPSGLHAINRISGLVLIGFSAWQLVSLID